ncbi:putative ras GTP exchange factor son of sevenless [Fasciola hepatica]|uniref:Ras GTP exchange factor son of sevenless n=1 Tax=Fasciola hepatica TaxID=6192 RepID=A0A4E0RE48_FASHE|nr:putative ras GTP exchange factor son of sevenless [Fasciola hepatica]
MTMPHGAGGLGASGHTAADQLSAGFSGRSIVSTSTLSNSSYIGSMLSVSTLTSSNTLIVGGASGGSVSVAPEGQSAARVTETEAYTMGVTAGIPTAGAAAAAASAALLGAMSASPKQRITFVFTSQEDKADWMAALVYLQLSRLFQRYLRDLPRQEIPLVLPSPNVYQFSTPDSITNIIFESAVRDSSVEIPIIKAATKVKLIERMTYHAYFDSNTVSVFLMTYRRYMTASELLELLIERFNVPEPDFTKAAENTRFSNSDSESPITVALRLEKRFRSVYKRRVQYRVLNFLIKWVKNTPFYRLDIQNNQPVRKRLSEFLDSVDARNLSDNVANIRKSLRGDRVRLIQTLQQLPPEPLDLGLVSRADDVRVTNVHPLELARQITLYEWELYSRIEFWEVNGKEKIKAPNLQASMNFSNKIKWWLVYSIMTADHLEDRLLVMQRIADLMVLLEQLNNLQGAQEAKAALLSSPVFRLYNTYDALITKSKPHHRMVFESLRRSVEADDGDAYVEDYEKKLHELNPPGLPFIAVGGKTQLIHLELKHPDWITVPNSTVTQPFVSSADPGDEANGAAATIRLVNFWKCRQIADLVEYYLSFQQTPYNFAVNEHIRNFLQTFDPLKAAGVPDEHSFDDLMHEKSLQIQPKPPGEPVMITERRLPPMEQRTSATLNNTPPDSHLTADSKEFRSLLHQISAMASSATATPSALESANHSGRSSVLSEVTEMHPRYQNQPSDSPSRSQDLSLSSLGTNSLGRGRPRVEDLKSHGLTQHYCVTNRLQSGLRVNIGNCSHHPSPRIARSASSSPAPSSVALNFTTTLVTSTTNHPTSCTCGILPPPLPPRLRRHATVDRYPEQFVNQLSFIGTPLENTHASCESPLSVGDKSVQLLENTSLPDFRTVHSRFASVDVDSRNRAIPPSLPPRPPRRKTGPPSSSATTDLTGAPVRSTASSVSPKFAVGSSTCSPAPQWGESHLDKAGSLDLTSPPCLPPRLHPRQTPSVGFTGAPTLILSATVAPASVEATSVGPNRSSPPPLPPKRQLSRGAFSYIES